MAAMNFNQEQFEKALLEERLPVLVEYWAPWCVYCRRIGPALDALADQYRDQVQIVKINIDDAPELAQQEQIRLIPTLVYYHEGEARESITAPGSKAEIENFLRQQLSR